MDPQTQDVSVPSAEQEPVTQSTEPSNGSEAVTNSEDKDTHKMPENQVPFERYQAANNAKRDAEEARIKAEERATELERELEAKSPKQPEEDIDPEVEKLIGAYAKKHGLLTKAELDAQRTQDQVRSDVKDLQTKYATSGIPFDDKAVYKYATDNGVSISSKASLEAVYRQMNFDKIMSAERQRALDSYKNNPNGVEKPGSSPSEPSKEDKNMSRTERKAARFQAVREKLGMTS